MRSEVAAGVCAILILASHTAMAQDKAPQALGELLYSTFCVSCHTTQMHWRDKKIARDLPGLRAQVLRWQTNVGQKWDRSDVDEVVNYLNRTFYKFPGATDKG